MCNRCDSTTQKADITEDLVVDGETFGCVKILCYLGDTLDGGGGLDLLQQLRIKSGWKHFRDFAIFDIQISPARDDLVYASRVRINIIYVNTVPS